MSASPEPQTAPPSQSLADLVEECRSLCASADLALTAIGGDRRNFLAQSLEDALQQVALILRVVGEETRACEEEVGGGFLTRLKRGIRAKSPEDGEVETLDIPQDGFAKQGLQGNSWTISLPELLGFLSSAQKTGVIWIDTPHENYMIGLIEGDLVHATSDRTPEGLRLGEVLVGLGFLTRRQLERFLERQPDDSWLSGESLLESGMISPEELHTALVYQVQQLFHRIMDMERALFRFREGLEVVQSNQVRLNVTQLLLESARVQDEMKQSGLLTALVGGSAPVQMLDPLDDWNAWQQQLSSIEAEAEAEAAQSLTQEPAAPAREETTHSPFDSAATTTVEDVEEDAAGLEETAEELRDSADHEADADEEDDNPSHEKIVVRDPRAQSDAIDDAIDDEDVDEDDED